MDNTTIYTSTFNTEVSLTIFYLPVLTDVANVVLFFSSVFFFVLLLFCFVFWCFCACFCLFDLAIRSGVAVGCSIIFHVRLND